MSTISPHDARLRRHRRVRGKVRGTASQPRLSVFRSLSNIYAQVIDDVTGVTLASASTQVTEVKAKADAQSKTEQAKTVGALLAKQAIGKGIVRVVFDRGGYMYHGRVKALADGAREAGLKF